MKIAILLITIILGWVVAETYQNIKRHNEVMTELKYLHEVAEKF